VRRAIAVGLGIVVLLILVFGVRGCLNSRRDSALRNYNNQVGQLASQSSGSLAPQFFSTLTTASSGSAAVQVENELSQIAYQAQTQASSAAALSVPSQMAAAQRNVLLALDLRQEAIQKIVSNIRTALGSSQAGAAIAAITGDMEMLLASDVIWSERVVPLIQQTLADASIGGQTVTPSRFLTNLSWLQTSQVTQALLGHPLAGPANASYQPGRHGHALVSVAVNGTTLTPGSTPNYITLGSGVSFNLTVQNQGQFNESNVALKVTVEGTGSPITGTATLPSTTAGQSSTAAVQLTGTPVKSTPLRLVATVEKVPGEVNLSNNTLDYVVIFQ
jgi:hypothetical protein